MANVKFKLVNDAEQASEAIEDRKLLYNYESKKIYVDSGTTTRIEFYGFMNANKTIYVATTGSDTTGDGTSGKPYATINKALSVLPKNFNGFDATINIAGGVYAENVLVNGFHGGALNLTLNDDTTINRLYVEETGYIFLACGSSKTLTINNTSSIPLTLTRSTNMQIYNVDLVLTTTSSYSGLLIDNLSNIIASGTVTINGASNGIYISNHSESFIETLAGSGNTTGIRGIRGSQISYGTKTISATTEKILTGSAIITNDLEQQATIGSLSNLLTTVKTNIVDAINSLVTSINSIIMSVGTLSNLTTTDKTSVVNAINGLQAIYAVTVSASSGYITVPSNQDVYSVQNSSATVSNDAVTSWQRTTTTQIYYNKSGTASTTLTIVYKP